MLGKRYGCALHENGGGLSGPGDLSQPAKAASYTPDKCSAAYTGDTLPDLMTDAIITAAGGVAVAVACCESMIHVSTADRNMLSAACREAFPDADYGVEVAFCNLAVARARALLSSQFHFVERVADALHECGRLSADDVAKLMLPE
jgi:hypothetical protein